MTRKLTLAAILSCDLKTLEKYTGLEAPSISLEDQDRLGLFFVHAYRIAKLKEVREEISYL